MVYSFASALFPFSFFFLVHFYLFLLLLLLPFSLRFDLIKFSLQRCELFTDMPSPNVQWTVQWFFAVFLQRFKYSFHFPPSTLQRLTIFIRYSNPSSVRDHSHRSLKTDENTRHTMAHPANYYISMHLKELNAKNERKGKDHVFYEITAIYG